MSKDIGPPPPLPDYSSYILSNWSLFRERLIDSKTMLPLKGGEMPLSTNRYLHYTGYTLVTRNEGLVSCFILFYKNEYRYLNLWKC